MGHSFKGVPMDKSLGKTGDASIKKIGHTVSNRFGIEPDAKVRGASTEPTVINFNK